MIIWRRGGRALAVLISALLFIAISPALPAEARGPIKVVGREVSTSVERQRVVELPILASHVALHWRGQEEAQITVAFSTDGVAFGEPVDVHHDDSGGHSPNGRTYGGVVWTEGARFVKVVTDRRLGQVTVVAIDARGPAKSQSVFGSAAAAAVDQPAIISRAGWNADESLRFGAGGVELWPPEFHPVQKLVVHHTAGRNDDPDPAATVRAILYHQAVVRGWGDIGYNFLIDEAGRIYEGRYSRPYGGSESPTGEDLSGKSVVGAHVANHNAGTVGIALLGHLVGQDAKPAARAALERLLAWKAERHGIDPQAGGTYLNPVNGVTKSLANISGHRDLASTLCPGDIFYATLPALRLAVAQLMSGPVARTVPGAPLLTARKPPSKPGVRLDWSAPADGGSAITSYRILRLKSGKFVRIATVSGSKLNYRDRTAKKGRTYTYKVRAVNAIGKGPTSNAASAVAR